MKIQLGKPLAENFKAYGWHGKPGWGILQEKLHLDLYFVYRKH